MLINARDISLIYDMKKNSNTYALKDITISTGKNELIGIMGPSGSGKSSLLYILSGLIKATFGELYYDGRDTSTLSNNALACLRREKFGLITQHNLLVEHLTVLDNVLIPCFSVNTEVINKALHLLKRLGIQHLADERPKELSFGQRQLVSIARALINKPEVVFADEPTAALDHKSAMDVMATLREQLDQASVIVATHDKSILEDADRIIQMWDGRIIQSSSME